MHFKIKSNVKWTVAAADAAWQAVGECYETNAVSITRKI